MSDAPPLADEDIPAIRFEIPEDRKAQEPDDTSSYRDAAMKLIRKNEGVRNKLYRDSKGYYTIGVGHLVAPERVAQFKKRGAMSSEEVDALFAQDFDKREAVARRLLGESFDRMPTPVKVAVLDGVFRGDLSGSPRTLELLKEGRYSQAAVEYLDNNEYRDSVRRNRAGEKHGVAARMERNAEAFRQANP